MLIFNKNEKARKLLEEGLQKIAQGDAQGGLERLNQAVAAAPKFAPALLARARLLAEAGKTDLAHADIDLVIELEPQVAGHFFFRGLCRRVQNEIESAIADFEQALRLDSGHNEAAFELSALFVRQERYQEALPLLDRALEMQPDDLSRRLTRARVLIALKKADLALEDVEKVARAQPHSVEACRLGAQALLGCRRYPEAVTLCREAMRLLEASPRADNKDEVSQVSLELAQALDRTGLAKDALAAATRAVTLNPQNNDALFFRGAMLQAQGRVPEAMEDYAELLHRFPGWVPVLINRSACYLTRGQASRAQADAEAVLKIAPDQPAALFNRARANVHLGDWMAAGADLTGLLERFPEDAEVWLERARVWNLAGRPEECADDRYEAVKRVAALQAEPLDPVKAGRFVTEVGRLRSLCAPA